MIFKKIVSSLVLVNMLFQAISPAFAILEEEPERQVRTRQRPITFLTHVSKMEQKGVFVRPGDMVILDLDETLAIEKNGVVLNLDPRVMSMVKGWQELNKGETNPHKHIWPVILTARTNKESVLTCLRAIGLPEDIDILLAPNDTRTPNPSTKGKILINYLREKNINPRRFLGFDDILLNLESIEKNLEETTDYAEIPRHLFLMQTQRRIYQSPDSKTVFPERLEGFRYIGHIAGDARGVHIFEEEKTRKLFTLKLTDSSDVMKEKFLGGELARVAGVNVPEGALYDHTPKFLGNEPSSESLERLKRLGISINKGCLDVPCIGAGPYLLAPFIEEYPSEKPSVKRKMKDYFVVNLLLRNFYGEKNALLGTDGNLWQIGNSSLRLATNSHFSSKKKPSSFMEEFEEMKKQYAGEREHEEELGDEVIKTQIEEIFRRQDKIFSALEDVSENVGLERPDEIREMLFERLDGLRKLYTQIFIETVEPSPKATSSKKHPIRINEGFIASSFASGIFIHSVDPQTGQKVILLGDRTGDEGFCNLGGKKEEGETLIQTAVIETQQESLGQMSFTTLDLEHSSSHTILNREGILYQMFIAHHPFRDPASIRSSQIVEKYGWTQEYDGYRWVPLEVLLRDVRALSEKKGGQREISEKSEVTCRKIKKKVKDEGKKSEEETAVIDGNITLYPPFWEMLQEPEVIKILEKILYSQINQVSFPYNRHTYNSKVPRFRGLPGSSFEQQGKELAKTVVRKVNVLSALKSRIKKEEEDEEESADIRSMLGYLEPETARRLTSEIQGLPTQTEAYYCYIMGAKDYATEELDPHKMVEKFFERQAHINNINPYKVRVISAEEKAQELASDEIALFLKNNILYAQIQGKEPLEVLAEEEDPESQISLFTKSYYESIKEGIEKNKKVSSDFEAERLLNFLHRQGYAPYLPLDPYYKKQLEHALEEEKKNPGKAVFYHASDPLTSFLWDIFRAYRAHLKILGESAVEILRGWDKQFRSIRDVEAFIKKYQNEEGEVDNYATVDGADHYADFGISVNPFLFGNGREASSCTFQYFYNSKSWSPAHHTKLFQAFMDYLGISGEFKDFEAIFRQYYGENSGGKNSKLVQIFIDLSVLDAVAYTSKAGGRILETAKDEGHPYHGFLKILKKIRAAPEDFERDQELRCLESMQGRLFLKPEIFHNSRYVHTKTYWRYPLQEENYSKALDRLVAQTLQESLSSKAHYWDSEMFFDGTPELERMYRLAHGAEMKTPYKGDHAKNYRSHFSQAITRGNLARLEEILREHPEIDLNEPFPNLSYRESSSETTTLPFGLLSLETPNFSEVVRILLQSGSAKIPRIHSEEVRHKILNELMGYSDKLSGHLLEWFKNERADLFSYRQEILASSICTFSKNGCDRILAYLSKTDRTLILDYLSPDEGKTVATLLTRGTIRPKTLKVGEADSQKAEDIFSLGLLDFLECLLGGEEVGYPYQQTSWFKDFQMQLNQSSPTRVISFRLYPRLASFAASRLKDNATLLALEGKSPEDTMYLLNLLLESDGEGYKKAPWFQEIWAQYLENPKLFASIAYFLKNDTLGTELSKVAKLETIDLTDTLKVRANSEGEREKLLEMLASNPFLREVGIGGVFYDWLPEWLERLFLHFKSRLETLQLSLKASKDQSRSLVKVLRKEHELGEIKAPRNVICQLMDSEISMVDKGEAEWKAPWIQKAWKVLLQEPQSSFFTAYRGHYYAVMRCLLESSSAQICLSEDMPDEFLRELEGLLKRNTPLQNSTLFLQSVELGSSWNAVFGALGTNTTLRSLVLEESIVSEDCVPNFLAALESNQTLLDVRCGKALTSQIMKHSFSQEGRFKDAIWFEKMKREFSFSRAISEGLEERPVDWDYMAGLFRNIQEESLDLSRSWLMGDKEWERLGDCLKENSTLKSIEFPWDQKLFVRLKLMSAPQGPFSKAPWFIDAKKAIIRKPGEYILKAMDIGDFQSIFNIFSEMPGETKLSCLLSGSYTPKFLEELVTHFLRNARAEHLNLSDIPLKECLLPPLGRVLKENTSLETLDLTGCFRDVTNFESLISDLRENKTLREIRLDDEERIMFLNAFGNEDELQESPWFTNALQHLLSNWQKSIRMAFRKGAFAVLHRIAQKGSFPSIDLSTIGMSVWSGEAIRAFMEGLSKNQMVQRITVSTNSFPGSGDALPVHTFLRTQTSLRHLTLKGWLDTDNVSLFEDVLKNEGVTCLNLEALHIIDLTLLDPFLNALKPNVKQLVCSEDLMFKIMSKALPRRSVFEQSPWFQNAERDFLASPKPLEKVLKERDFIFLKELLKHRVEKSLDLTQYNWNEEDWEQFAESIQENEMLEDLRLPDHKMPVVMVKLMSGPQGPFLKAPWFVAARPHVIENPAAYIEKAFQKRNFNFIIMLLSLRSEPLKLSRFINDYSVSEFLKALIEVLPRNEDLQNLDLSALRIEDSLATPLGKALRSHKSLQTLDLRECRFSDQARKSLVAELQENTTLQQVLWSDNESVRVLIELYKPSSRGGVPWVTKNFERALKAPEQFMRNALWYREEGKEIAIQSIVRETNVLSLDLGAVIHNTYGNETVLYFAFEGLKENKTVEKLELDLQLFQSLSRVNFQDFFAQNKTIKTLILKGKRLVWEKADAFVRAVKDSTISEFYIEDSEFKNQVLDEFVRSRDQISPEVRSWVERQKNPVHN